MNIVLLGICMYSSAGATALMCRLFFDHSERCWEENTLIHAVCWIAQAIVVCLILGYCQMLSPASICISHCFLFIITVIFSRNQQKPGTIEILTSPFQIFLPVIEAIKRFFREPGNISLKISTAVGLCFIFLALLVNLLTEPSITDSLSYRLTRIAYWLQEGSISHFITSDSRMNYSAFNMDLVILWFTGFFQNDYPLAKFPGLIGGLLNLLAIWGFGRILGFSFRLRLLGTLFFLTIPSVSAQLITTQTDLFTAGCVNAGLYFLWRSVIIRSYGLIILGGISIAIGVGAKGTVFYWGFGMLGLVLWWWFRYPQTWKLRMQGTGIVLCCILCLALPRYIENFINYGSPFAPKEEMKTMWAGEDNVLKKGFIRNSIAYGIQLCYPHYNPLIPNSILEKGHHSGISMLSDGGSPESLTEHVAIQKSAFQLRLFDPDMVNSGILPFLLFVASIICALYKAFVKRSKTAQDILIIGLAITMFFVVFCTIQQWSPFKQRYFVLLLPLVTVCIQFLFASLKEMPITGLIGVVALYLIWVAQIIFWTIPGNGFPHWRGGDKYFYITDIAQKKREALERASQSGERVLIALPYNVTMSSFFRNGLKQNVRFLPEAAIEHFANAESAIKENNCDILVTSPKTFQNRHGNVYTSTYFDRLRPEIDQSILCYRLLKTDEPPNPFVSTTDTQEVASQNSQIRMFSIENNLAKKVSFSIHNPSPVPCLIEFRTSIEYGSRPCQANTSEVLEMQLKENDRAFIKISVKNASDLKQLNRVTITPKLSPIIPNQ